MQNNLKVGTYSDFPSPPFFFCFEKLCFSNSAQFLLELLRFYRHRITEFIEFIAIKLLTIKWYFLSLNIDFFIYQQYYYQLVVAQQFFSMDKYWLYYIFYSIFTNSLISSVTPPFNIFKFFFMSLYMNLMISNISLLVSTTLGDCLENLGVKYFLYI